GVIDWNSRPIVVFHCDRPRDRNAAVAVGNGVVLNARSMTHSGRPSASDLSESMTVFGRTADINGERARCGRFNVCSSWTPTGAPDPKRTSPPVGFAARKPTLD